MNAFSNIWNHPRTSATGVLIALVTIAGVFSQQGISFGRAGSGSTISLVTALATAMLGLLAKDPDSRQTSSGQTAKLSAWLLIALLLPLPWMEGCTAASAAQDIVNWTPALQSAVATVDSTASLFAPSDAAIFTIATSAFDADSNVLVNQAKAYLANPSASVLVQLQSQVVTLQQQVNAALLQASKITNSASEQHAVASIQAVATIVTAILTVVQSVSTKTAVAQMAAHSTIKLATVEPYLDRGRSAAVVAAHYNEPLKEARSQIAQAEQNEVNAGF